VSVAAFVESLRKSPEAEERLVHLREEPPRPARFADPERPLPPAIARALAGRGIERLYAHQARALDLVRSGRDAVVVTGPASGKSLCYQVPVLEALAEDPAATALLLFPAKALARDQLASLERLRAAAGIDSVAGVADGDTPGGERRNLRERARAILTNPDFLHAAILPRHPAWARFFGGLRIVVLDEVHTYSGIFGANLANLMRRLLRVCRHHGADPRLVAGSATIGNPGELAERLTGRPFEVVDDDGSPRGRRTFAFWNPPRVRATRRRSRKSANVEAHELTAALVRAGIRTITFSKARVTAELIHRYVGETLRDTAPHLARRVAPYRGGLLPEERREIERRLFGGELLGVSTTRALELGIDVGGLDAAVVVGWPGTVASFFQQAGRAGRRDGDALVVLVGHDSPANQYVLRHPEYVFDRGAEHAAVEPENPFVLTGHLRCAAHELPLAEGEAGRFGPHGDLVMEVLEEHRKVRRIGGRWYHAAAETPQHEVSLRDATDRNVVIEDAETGRLLGEVSKFDAPTVRHPEAIHLRHGETWRVLALDLEKSVATVKRVDADYYTQSKGGDDVHHVDRTLRRKPFGTGTAAFGEVTAYFRIHAYEKIRFYTLDAVSKHGLDLPVYPIETMAVWFEPPESLMREVRAAGLEPTSGLRGIGYATRMLLPIFVRCDALDLSHTVGCVNSSWRTVFVWEHYPRGLGYTRKAYDRLHEILPRVRRAIRDCPCRDGCPLCVGKPLHPYAVLNPERGEGAIPSKRAALLVLDGLLGDGSGLDAPDEETLTDSPEALRVRLSRSLRRRRERVREPDVLHAVAPRPPSGFPSPEDPSRLDTGDAERRGERRRSFRKKLRRIGRGGFP